ncbi:hypothetical protein HDU91_000226, partial [Kappamyces sp. JEL0680]
ELEGLLLKYPNAIVGEIGIDKKAVNRETGQLFEWAPQVDVFTKQVELASRLQRPVSVHSVHTHGYLLDYFSDLDRKCIPFAKDGQELPCPPTIMLHSFSASSEILKALIKLPRIGDRFYFSYSHTVNARSGKKTLEKIALTPDSRLLIESDVHCVTQVPEALQKVVEMVGEAKKWTSKEVVDRTTRNALVFLRKLVP